ncbi:hypothetical protein H4Q32_011644 [Labeo rohita]|uniref:Uncharacterized protein n=1 Tax=Labeo rohita TaxID=84645 RepID=A0ABQ8MLC0_LABRO|nr:hypothetical protein H4Q32_011644 [Labeo rohita]
MGAEGRNQQSSPQGCDITPPSQKARPQGGSDGGRSQGADRRDSEQEEPGETQTTAMMVFHGGAEGGAMVEEGLTTPGDNSSWVAPRIRRAKAEPRALATEADAELEGGRSPTEPVGRSDKAQPEEWSPEAMAGRRPTKAEPEGQWSPVELVDRRATVELRAGVAESRTQRLEAETRDPPAMTPMETGRPEASPRRVWVGWALGGPVG